MQTLSQFSSSIFERPRDAAAYMRQLSQAEADKSGTAKNDRCYLLRDGWRGPEDEDTGRQLEKTYYNQKNGHCPPAASVRNPRHLGIFESERNQRCCGFDAPASAARDWSSFTSVLISIALMFVIIGAGFSAVP